MQLPRNTDITPSFNRGRFLERTICSVLDQGYGNLEYFVVDGGSDDESVEARRLYERDLAGWISVPNRGMGDAINQGLKRATGDIVAVLAAEDLYLPGALDTVAAQMERNNSTQWLVGQCIRVGASDQMLGWMEPTAPKSLASFLMHDSGVLPLASSFFRRELLNEYGEFDMRLPLACDYEYTCRLLASGLQPTVLNLTLVARREESADIDAQQTVQCGLQHIAAARRYADQLPVSQRYPLWRNWDVRQRIYKLAEAEIRGSRAQRFLWQELLRHPWWLVDNAVRRALRHGVPETMTAGRTGAAA